MQSSAADFFDQREPFAGPFAKSALFHLALAASIIGYAYLHHLHGSEWGSNTAVKGAIQATLVSSASLPLPLEHPPTENVLATDTPSQAPAPPLPKIAPLPEPTAVPIPVKQAPVKPVPKPVPQTPTPPPRPQPLPKQQNRATYGEAAPANVAKAASNNQTSNSPVAVNGSDFGSRFPWYLDVIRRKVAQNWYTQEVQPGTPVGAVVFVSFSVSRDGSPSGVRIEKSSGSPTLDSSCLRAVQRTDSFGPLPGAYSGSTILVSYYCDFEGR